MSLVRNLDRPSRETCCCKAFTALVPELRIGLEHALRTCLRLLAQTNPFLSARYTGFDPVKAAAPATSDFEALENLRHLPTCLPFGAMTACSSPPPQPGGSAT